MRDIGRHVVIDDDRLGHLVELRFRAVVAQQLVDRDDVERAVAEGDAGRHVEALENGLDVRLPP